MPLALVTGASSDLGAAITLGLLDAGHSVIATGRRPERLEPLQAQGATVLPGDLTEPSHLDSLAGHEPTILVHAAGHPFAYQRFHAADPAQTSEIWAVDHHAFAELCRRVLPAMMRSRSGRLLALTSAAARLGSDGAAAYASAKAATEALIRNLALEYGRFGITANAVAPGPVRTERLQRRIDGGADLDKLTSACALRRLSTPEEVAAAVVFLCSAEAGAITGTTLPVDGGLGLAGPWR